MASKEVASTPADGIYTPMVMDWSSVQWETAVQESGDQIVFNEIGDVFVGLYIGSITAHNPKDDEDFTILQFTGVDGKPYQTNAGWKLREGFSDIPSNTIVRITFVKQVDVGQNDPMNDFRIDVASTPR
jgi:hypothetical protein